MYYCESCGKKVNAGAKFCRYCGHLLGDKLGDTQPLPAITGQILVTSNQPKKFLNFKNLAKQLQKLKIKKYTVLSYLTAFITAVCLIYVLVTFKTVDEYQMLTGTLGLLLILYFWHSAK